MSKINSVEMLEAIRPPKGFNLFSLVVCSYTFDPDLGLALLSHVSDDSLESHAVLEDIPGNREKIRQLLLENLPNSLFICDGHGPFTGKSEISGIRCIFLDQVVKKTRHTNELGSFHPKIILATYIDEQKNYCGRLYIGSKNLSRNTMQEYGVVINLIQQKRKTKFSKELLNLLNDLEKNEISHLARSRNDVIEKTIKLLEKCNLTSEDPSVSLFWQSRWGGNQPLHQQLDNILKKTWTEINVHSLWVRETAVDWLNLNSKNALIRIKCLRQKGFNYPVLSNSGGYQFEVESTNQNDRHRWHQKIILFRNATTDFLVFGSANFTSRGFGFSLERNSEVMISFEKRQGEFKYLDIKGNIEQGQDLSDSSILKDPNDFIYELLNQIEIKTETEYLKGKRTLRYLIQHDWNSKYELKIYHIIIENAEFNSGKGNKVLIFSGKDLPNEIEHVIAEKNIYLYSSLIRFEVEVNGKILVVDSLVDLPDIFYASRKNTNKLNCLKLGQKEILAALLDLTGEPVPSSRVNSNININPLDLGKDVELFARHLSLERMAFSISRNKTANPRIYSSQLNRLKNIAVDIEAIAKEPSAINFQHLLDSIKEILSVL